LNNELTTLSDHVLTWLLREEEISDDLRQSIESELLNRSLSTGNDEFLTLTSKMLHDASTCGYHGFNAAQLAVLGMKWPPKKGWLKRLIGSTITTSQYLKFVKAGKKLSKSGQ